MMVTFMRINHSRLSEDLFPLIDAYTEVTSLHICAIYETLCP